MDPAEALHPAARRYCIDEATRWRDEHAAILERQGDDDIFAPPASSDEERRVYPRYQVLDAILAALEAMPSASLADLASARAALAAAGTGARPRRMSCGAACASAGA